MTTPMPSSSSSSSSSGCSWPLVDLGPALVGSRGASSTSGSRTRGLRPRRDGMPLQPSFFKWRWRWSERTKVLKQLEH
ncbi:hypothetical protein PGIGA_G00027490 [Pangasianodon gigas]|uniref:Uncharacterized protein n=1 Tax=Pangasianodon gigas TaxID=30993 RepID=A0ACC5WWS3_PANGG|nr:hypothetical protein [Pangasianodon gigas]